MTTQTHYRRIIARVTINALHWDPDMPEYHARQREGESWQEAATRIAHKLGYSHVALVGSPYAHSPSQHTYLIQFGRAAPGGGTNLSEQYRAYVVAAF